MCVGGIVASFGGLWLAVKSGSTEMWREVLLLEISHDSSTVTRSLTRTSTTRNRGLALRKDDLIHVIQALILLVYNRLNRLSSSYSIQRRMEVRSYAMAETEYECLYGQYLPA